MSKLVQGTQIYFIDPDDSTVMEIKGVTSHNPGGTAKDQVEDTTIADSARSYLGGLGTPGQAAFGLNADPEEPSHIRLFELSQENSERKYKFAVGWSDGKGIAPTADSNGDFVLPTTRTWYVFTGYVADFPFDFAINAVVSSAVNVQRSGAGEWTKKVIV